MGPIAGTPCVFDPGARGVDRRAVIMGLYPPPGSISSAQHADRTSQEIASVMGNYNFDWNDLYPVAPHVGTKCTDVDLGAMHCHIKERLPAALELVTAWAERMEALVERERAHGNAAPVVIWAGETVNLAREWLAELGIVRRMHGEAEFATPWCRVVTTDRFVSVEDAVHPSAHLQAGGEEAARCLFQDTYACLEALRCAPHADADALLVTMGEAAGARRAAMVGALDALGIPHDGGWLDVNVRHLRLVTNWSNPELLASLKRLKESMSDSFVDVLCFAPACHLNVEFVKRMLKWRNLLGSDKFVTFMCDSVASKLLDDAFNARMLEWRDLLGSDKFVTFMCNGVASKLLDDAFNARMLEWRDLLGSDKFVTFMCNGVASKLLDDAFNARMLEWRDLLGSDKFVTFMYGGVASKLLDDAFNARMLEWRDLLGSDKFASFMCDGVASKLLDDAFNARMLEWRDLLGSDKFVTFMCGGVASKLLDDAFNARMLEWRDLLGSDKFVAFMCNGVASKLLDDAFNARMLGWRDLLGSDKFVTFMCNGVASKLLDDAFNARMLEWRDLLGSDKFVTFMCNSVASKLLDDAFNARMLEWRDLLGSDTFVTFMCNGVASKLLDDAFNARMLEWRDLLGSDTFVTFMCGGVASKLLDDAFNARMLEWRDLLGSDTFVAFMCGGIAARWRVIPIAMIAFIGANTWLQKMTHELCRRVPLNQQTQIDAALWTDVYATMGAKRKR
jgi:hypothetical protein